MSFNLSSVNILLQLSLSLSLSPKLSLQPTNCDSLEYLYGKIWQLFNVPYDAKPWQISDFRVYWIWLENFGVYCMVRVENLCKMQCVMGKINIDNSL